MNCFSSEHIDDLMPEVSELCTKSMRRQAGTTAAVTHSRIKSGKARQGKAVKEHRSRFKAKDDAQ